MVRGAELWKVAHDVEAVAPEVGLDAGRIEASSLVGRVDARPGEAACRSLDGAPRDCDRIFKTERRAVTDNGAHAN